MRDRPWILMGLVLLLAVALFPAWHGVLSGDEATPPDLELPLDSAGCVESTEYMIANHPALLNEWRDAVVREGRTEHVSADGKTHAISFTGTCMGCHKNRETFCLRCHEYADVQPTCWECHVEPSGK
jgi:hypothetical protein